MSDSPATTARRLMRGLDRATLATSLDGWPYASLVLAATGPDGAPLLLLSDLAEHTRNLKREPRASLLFDGTGGLAEPLTGARVTVLGEMARIDDQGLLRRYVARHPSAAAYAGFGDFHLYRLAVRRGHLVAGFGRIDWIAADGLLLSEAEGAALAEAEPDILAHMNGDHAEALDLYAERLAGRAGSGWRMTGIDPEGLDLRRAGEVARLDFDGRVADAAAARSALVGLAQKARSIAG
jgi:putative heme iron utilization protein